MFSKNLSSILKDFYLFHDLFTCHLFIYLFIYLLIYLSIYLFIRSSLNLKNVKWLTDESFVLNLFATGTTTFPSVSYLYYNQTKVITSSQVLS